MRILATACFSFSAAIILAQYLLPLPWMLPLAIFCAVLAAAGWFLIKRQRLRIVLITGGLALGFLWNFAYQSIFFLPALQLDQTTGTHQATVRSFPEETKYGTKVELDLDHGAIPIHTLFYGKPEHLSLKPGDRIAFTARLARANLRQGKGATYHTAKGIFLLAYQKGDVSVVGRKALAITTWPAYAARAMQQVLTSLYPGADQAALMQALLTGDRSDMADSMSTALSRTGLSHIVAVSGMHLSFLAGVILLLPGSRRRKFFIAVPVLLFFMAATGNSPSVVRAGIMQLLLLLAPLCRRETDAPTSLAVALAVLLAGNPFSAASIGLQLSFASVAGLCLLSARIDTAIRTAYETRRHKDAPGLLRALSASVSSSVGAMVFTIPLCAYHFGTVSLVALLSNFLVLWAVSIVFVGGLFSGLLGLL